MKKGMTLIPINTAAGGVARTVKATSYKDGFRNIVLCWARGRFGATAVAEIDEEMDMEGYTDPGGLWFRGVFVPEGSGVQPDASEKFQRGGLPGLSRTLKAQCASHAAGVCVSELDMKEESNNMEYTEKAVSEPDSEGWFRVERTYADGTVKRLRKRYRVRKLTNRECFRLMGMPEGDMDRVQESGISRSQQYKLAGNSIVVGCLKAIFTELFAVHEDGTGRTLFG